jgi:heptosyltransferase-2
LQKTLVIGPSWVGDTILAQPLLIRLREIYPDAQIDVLAPAWTAPLLRRMPEVTHAITAPFAHGALNLAQRIALARELGARGYARAVVLPNSFKSALIPWLARIPTRTGYVGELRYGLLNDVRKLDQQALPMIADRYAALAQGTGEPLARPLPGLHLRVDEQARSRLLHELGLNVRSAPVICLCPGAEYGPAKRWPAAYFGELARQLQQEGFQVWVIGSDKDRGLAQQIAQASGGTAVDLTGRTNLEQAIDLLSCAMHVVSNDSGLMHVAAALGVSLLALYGSSSPAFTPPLSHNARIARLDLPCSPCYQRECPLGHFNCMRELTPMRIHQMVMQMHQPQPADPA